MDFSKKDRFDTILEKKYGYKKAYEKPGSASYICEGYVYKKEDGKVLKMNVKRVDLGRAYDSMHHWFVRTYRSDSVCPYSNRHCSEGLGVEEHRIFFKKLKKMERIYKLYTLKEWFLRKFRNVFGRRDNHEY